MIGGVIPHLHVNRPLVTNKRITKIYSVTIYQQKTKIVTLQGASNIPVNRTVLLFVVFHD